MMELIKNNVNCLETLVKGKVAATLEDYHNISDTLPDVDIILKEDAIVANVSVKEMDGRMAVMGKLSYKVLYLAKDKTKLVNEVCGDISFREPLTDELVTGSDYEDIRCIVEDINVKLINSRKLGISAVIIIDASLHEIKTKELTGDTVIDANKLCENIEVSSLGVCKKDAMNIKLSGILGAGKPEVKTVLYSDVRLCDREVRVIDGAICIRGSVNVFFIYECDEENIAWYETVIPFDEVLSVREIDERMIPECTMDMGMYTFNIVPDKDGKSRNIDIDMELLVGIKAYEDIEAGNLKDVYSPEKEYAVETCNVELKKVLIHNKSKCQINENIVGKSDEGVLILVHSMAKVNVTDSVIVSGGIEVNGYINVWGIVSLANDDKPFDVVKGQIPFSHRIEASGIEASDEYTIDTYVEQLSIEMLSSGEYRVRALIALDTTIKRPVNVRTVCDIKEVPFDMEGYVNMPGIVGIITKEGDTLWNIAKRFHTSPQAIMDINHRKSEEIKCGEKLIIVKKGSCY